MSDQYSDQPQSKAVVPWSVAGLLLIALAVVGYAYNTSTNEKTAKISDLMAQLDQAKKTSAALQTDLDQAKAGGTKVQAQLDETKAESANTQAQLTQARAATAELRAQLAAAKTGTSDLESQAERSKADATVLLEHLHETMAAATEVRKEFDLTKVDLLRLQQQLRDSTTKTSDLQAKLEQAQSQIAQLTPARKK